MKFFFSIGFIFVFHIQVCVSQVSGRAVNDDGEAIPFVHVAIEGSQIGTMANEFGAFILDSIPSNAKNLRVSSLGYQSKIISINPAKLSTSLGEIILEDDMLGLNEIVVTGTMKETFVKASPLKVEVISSDRMLGNIPVTNLMQGLKLINGVQEVVACGVCMTNSISINGLPGNYSAVLMDGSPIYGSLAAVYGLNGIPIQMIERIEVVKGPSSTLYGSEAIAGVLNIITKDPEFEPLASFDVMGSSHGEMFGNASFSNQLGSWRALTGFNIAHMNNFIDDNGDNFGDIAGMDRVSLFSKWTLKRKDYRKFTIASKLYYEDRRNGVEDFFKDRAYQQLRGSDAVYGESIYTLRAEVFGTYELPTETNLRIDYSLSWHDQDSYYGADRYTAKQGIAFSNFIWQFKKKKHALNIGLTNRVEFYDDNTVATDPGSGNGEALQYIPGIFAEDELELNDRLVILGGIRLDHYHRHGFIPSPRAGAKYKLNQWTDLRMSAGTGFKIVNLFTEDHAFITGQRQVEIVEELNPERSWNVSSNFNHTHAWFGTSGSFDVDVYYTRFNNKITPNYDTPGKIIYSNSPDWAQSYGVALSFSQQFSIPLAYNIGINVNKSELQTVDESGAFELKPLQYAPLWSGMFSLNYRFKKARLDLSYTANATGPMSLPEVFELNQAGEQLKESRPTVSAPFIIQNIQLTKQFRKMKRFECYGGVQNLFDFIQSYSPLVGINDPAANPGFSPFFDTSYAYAPLHGREVFLGIRLTVDRKTKN